MANIELDIEIEVYCAKCGDRRHDADGYNVGEKNRKNPSIEVWPCKNCIENRILDSLKIERGEP